MLKVIDYEDNKSVNIEHDIYTPINIEIGTWNISKEPTLYWRTGDFKKSLIEIGIGKDTGNIRSITLTLCEHIYKMENLNFNMNKLALSKGLPVFQVEENNHQLYIDESSKLSVYIGTDKVILLFSENEIVSVVQNDKVGFALDDTKNLCGIIVGGLVKHEKEVLEEALNY